MSFYPVLRDRLAHWLNRRGWSVARMGAGDLWILGGCHVVNRYHYRKVTVYLWKRAFQYERRW